MAGVFLLACIYWLWIMPHLKTIPEDAFQDHTAAMIFYNSAGSPVHHQTGSEYRYFFPVSLQDLPQHLIDVTVAAEDRRFFDHSGVDLFAVMRAAKQFITSGRIISGASTITMQLVSMRQERAAKSRSFQDKIAQMHEARNFELTHSKEEILELYFNVLPYGGKIYGIEAAARYYFGRHAADLNPAESIMLCGLPQAPSRLRPDRHPARARKRFERIVAMLVDQDYFTQEQADEILNMDLRYRDFFVPFLPRSKDTHFYDMVQTDGKSYEIMTTQDSRLTGIALDMLKKALPSDNSVQDAAMVVIENKTGKVRVLIGTLDFSAEKTGQVNAALASRSPGSLLKPFFYGEALSGGLILPETILNDAPVNYAGYQPGNFSGTFIGPVRADDALAMSLNTPVIRLLRELGVARTVKKLQSLDLLPAQEKNIVADTGLALALGGKETNLLTLTRVYSALANNSLIKKPVFLEKEEPGDSIPVWDNPAITSLLLKMMQRRPLQNAEHLPVAWKTGTSNGLRDAWCIAVMPEHTVGVWFGNKNGKSSPHLVGAEIAAPIVGKMIAILSSAGEEWLPPTGMEDALLCAKSGLAASDFCKKTYPGQAIKNIPLRHCALCVKTESGSKNLQKVKMISPRNGIFLTEPGKNIRFTIEGNFKTYHIYHNGSYEGLRKNGDAIEFAPGVHTVSFWSGEGTVADEIKLTVRDE